MKIKKLLILTVLLCFKIQFAHSDNSDILFVNLNKAPEASVLNLEVKIEDTVYKETEGVGYLTAHRFIVPSGQELMINFLSDQTGEPHSYISDFSFVPGQLHLIMYYGDQSSRSIYLTVIPREANPGNVAMHYWQYIEDLPSIDLLMRNSEAVLAQSAEHGDRISNIDISAENDILDIFNAGEREEGLLAYNLPAGNLDGEFIYLFSYMPDIDSNMYMLQTDGTITELERTEPFSSDDVTNFIVNSEREATLEIYPNPAQSTLSVNTGMNNQDELRLRILTSDGRLVLTSTEKTVDISNLEAGIYIAEVETGSLTERRRLVILGE